MNIEPAKSAYPILPKIIKHENNVKIEKGKSITFDKFLINMVKKIDIKKDERERYTGREWNS